MVLVAMPVAEAMCRSQASILLVVHGPVIMLWAGVALMTARLIRVVFRGAMMMLQRDAWLLVVANMVLRCRVLVVPDGVSRGIAMAMAVFGVTLGMEMVGVA